MKAVGAVPQLIDTRALARFVDPLPIPTLAAPTGIKPGPAGATTQVPYYRIIMRQFQAKVHRDISPTTFWGYGSSCPGPTLEVREKNPVFVCHMLEHEDNEMMRPYVVTA
jgi:spore coat protein A, manganese oxidase